MNIYSIIGLFLLISTQIACSNNKQLPEEKSNKFGTETEKFQQYVEQNPSPEQQDVEAKNKVAKAIERTSLEKAEQVANIFGTGAMAIRETYRVGSTIYYHYNPSDDQQLHAEYVKIELKKIRARHAIRECMVRNRKTAKDEDNVPYICREKFEEFVTVATEQEIEETKRLVNLR